MQSTYANTAALVSTEWVANHLSQPDLRLLEVDVDTSAYERGHIPGAVDVNWTTELGDPIRRDIPSLAAFEQLMGRCGVSSQTHVVLYGDNNNWFAAFAYWLARIYGHASIALMNGGRKSGSSKSRARHRPHATSSQRSTARAGRTSSFAQASTTC